MKYTFVVAISLFFSVKISYAQDAKKVLFVGNSYTYFWNLPQHVNIMAETMSIKIETRASTAGGSHWGHHWRGERELKTKDMIENGDFDIIVLQNHSMSTINRLDSLMHFGIEFAALTKKSNTRILLFESWSRIWDPYMQKKITAGYDALGKKINAQVVPVGRAWELALDLRPDLPLYDSDGSHPSSLGTYLNACIFFGVIAQKSPVGLPARLMTTDHDGEKIYLNFQSKEDALFCQKVAEEIINEFVD